MIPAGLRRTGVGVAAVKERPTADVSIGRRVVAAAVVAVAVVGTPVAHGLQIVNGTFDPSSLATLGVICALLGGLVLVRQPQNVLGVVLAAIGVGGVLGAVAEAVTTVTYGSERFEVPGAEWAGWFGDWYWLPTIWLLFVAVPLLFPDGRPAGPGWRRFGQVGAAVATGSTLVAATGRQVVLEGVQLGRSAESTVRVVLDSPLPLLPIENFEQDAGFLILLLPLFATGSVVSLFLRYRRSGQEVRRQLKVVVVAIAVAVVGFAAFAALDGARLPAADLLQLPLLLLIPVALGVGILRYRIYDIDRVVSRTVAWLLVSAVLVGIYLTGVVVLQSLLRPVTGGGDLPVALATLAAAALARPLLRQVQEAVDRRFNRAHVDAAHMLDAFARGLRDEVSRDTVVAQLREATHRTFQPHSVGVLLVTAAESEGTA